MKKYEAVFILNDRKFDDGGEAFSTKVVETLGQCEAVNVKKESLGRKAFARNIGKRTHGIYWCFYFDMAPGQVEDFQDKFRLEEHILRHVVYLYDKPEGEIRTLDLEK